jgi:hypothetical protein
MYSRISQAHVLLHHLKPTNRAAEGKLNNRVNRGDHLHIRHLLRVVLLIILDFFSV